MRTVHRCSIHIKRLTRRPTSEDLIHAQDPAEPDLLAVLQALSDPVRLEIVRQLAGCDEGSGLSCGQIALEVTKSTASHHLKSLRCAGIVAEREEGTRKYVWLRGAELERRFPGLLHSILRAARAPSEARQPPPRGRTSSPMVR